jgi:hypothetical protein
MMESDIIDSVIHPVFPEMLSSSQYGITPRPGASSLEGHIPLSDFKLRLAKSITLTFSVKLPSCILMSVSDSQASLCINVGSIQLW